MHGVSLRPSVVLRCQPHLPQLHLEVEQEAALYIIPHIHQHLIISFTPTPTPTSMKIIWDSPHIYDLLCTKGRDVLAENFYLITFKDSERRGRIKVKLGTRKCVIITYKVRKVYRFCCSMVSLFASYCCDVVFDDDCDAACVACFQSTNVFHVK